MNEGEGVPPDGRAFEPSPLVKSADRPANPRIAAIVIAVVAGAYAAATDPLANGFYGTMDAEPPVRAVLEAQADPDAPSAPPVRRGVFVLVDGLRVDEANELSALRSLSDEAVHGELRLPLPTISQPFYHAALTSVPQAGSGARTNALGRVAVFDTLPDRVRAASGTVAIFAENLDWMTTLVGEPSDLLDASASALLEPLDRVLNLPREEAPDFLLVHILEVDESAHRSGTESDEHRRALRDANEVLRRIVAKSGDAALMIVSDHGHIRGGGHGGDEPEVRRSPFYFRSPGVPPGTIQRDLQVEELAPTLAAWMGIAPPRSSIGVCAPELRPPGYRAAPVALARAETLRRAEISLDSRLGRARTLWVAVWAFLALCALGALRRSFHDFDRGTLLAPVLGFVSVVAVHRWVWDRPFTMSAIEDIDRHGPHLVFLGLGAGVFAIGAAVLLGRRAVPLKVRTRRAAGAVAWAALACAGFSVAWVGGSLGPWSVSALAAYLPIVAMVTAAGASIAAAVVLLGTAPFRERPPSE
ncbi:MAG: alkaline phosphatase family protein [Myxococcota bacterium]